MHIVCGPLHLGGADGIGRPGQVGLCALRVVHRVLRLGADNEADAAFAARDALGGLMDVAHRAFTADRAVEIPLRANAEPLGEPGGQVVIAPADQGDDVDAVDLPQEAARFRIGAPRRFGHQGDGLERLQHILRPVGDLADAGDDGNAVGGRAVMRASFRIFRCRNQWSAAAFPVQFSFGRRSVPVPETARRPLRQDGDRH